MSTGGWVAIWVLLFIAALAFYVVLGLHLYRKVKVVLSQASSSVELFDSFNRAMEDADLQPFTTPPALAATAEDKAGWTRTRRVNRVRRAKRKTVRRRVTLQRWREMPFPISKAYTE